MDEILLLVANVGAFALPLFRGLPGAAKLVGGETTLDAFLVMFREILVVVGTFLQTVFIGKALHCKTVRHGRIRIASIATYLGWLNISIWLINTIEVEGLDNGVYNEDTMEMIDNLQRKRFEASWLIFLLLCFPVAIFYCIHSSIVLYKISKKHKCITGRDAFETDRQREADAGL